jgi:hypothetical protein
MKKRLSFAASALVLCGGFALAQTNVQTPQPERAPAHPNSQAANPQAAPTRGRLTPQMLGEMLRSATTFHELAQNLNIGKLLGPDQHVIGPDGQLHHSMERTAQTVGAGAGAGAAIGAMTHSQNGVLIGALIGAGSGMILDQILKERENQRSRAANAAAPNVDYTPVDQQLKLRTRDGQLERQPN